MTFALEHPVAWLRGLLPSSDCKVGDVPCGLGHAAKRKCKAPYNQSPEKRGSVPPLAWVTPLVGLRNPSFSGSCSHPAFGTRADGPPCCHRRMGGAVRRRRLARRTRSSASSQSLFDRRVGLRGVWRECLRTSKLGFPVFGVVWIGGLFTYPLQIQIQSKPLTMACLRDKLVLPLPERKKTDIQSALARFVDFATMIECCWFVQGGPNRCLCSC